ncbi:unnamed protein product [Thelazia callipaeda]|uniref:CBS domain-containing protein n=1 Tax=Thelazia callipaeda TaxID=103827 RepID=A0A0N5CV21_THECL|nr:unnamed protein product [Thelazia callipaeda]
MNIYHHHDDSFDSAQSSGESSRKNSSRLSEFRQFVKRKTSIGKMSPYKQLARSLPNESVRGRKYSTDSQFFDMDESDEERGGTTTTARRHFSVPEKDYAIMRQSRERHLEVVTAFDRYMDPYKQYMQSLLCYDLAPVHGSALLLYGDLSMRKSLLALYHSGHEAAVIINPSNNAPEGMLTVTDCLRAVMVSLNVDPNIGECPVRNFIRSYGKKKLITGTVNMSVWNAGRLFCLNHVHRIPIFQTDESDLLIEILYLLSLRRVFCEAIIKLVEPTAVLAPHVKHRTLYDSGVGTWNSIVTISSDASCGEAINELLDKKLSCIAVVNEYNMILGKISKNDIMYELVKHPKNYLEIIDIPVKDVYRVPPLGRPTNTVYESIILLLSTDDQCLFIVDCNQRVMGTVSFIDIMNYILKSSDRNHKSSGFI